MLQKLRQRQSMKSEEGFTLVELLVVILIIGILAAIAIPSFLSQREKAQDAEAKSAVKTAATAMETYFTDQSPQTYVGANPAALQAIEETLNDAAVTVPVAAGNNYSVRVTSDTGNTFDIVRAANGSTTRPCNGDGGCGTDNVW